MDNSDNGLPYAVREAEARMRAQKMAQESVQKAVMQMEAFRQKLASQNEESLQNFRRVYG